MDLNSDSIEVSLPFNLFGPLPKCLEHPIMCREEDPVGSAWEGEGEGEGARVKNTTTGMGTLYTSNKKFRCVKAATSDVCSRLLSFLEAIKIIK